MWVLLEVFRIFKFNCVVCILCDLMIKDIMWWNDIGVGFYDLYNLVLIVVVMSDIKLCVGVVLFSNDVEVENFE